MKVQLAERIWQLRKQQSMSQEQLAEAMGVSTAAVSKWERGAATPELRYLVELADLFGVSLDALVGYELRSSAAEVLEERIHSLQREKNFETASVEAEKALVRYPNDFRVVKRCGEMYQMKGVETGDVRALEKAVELMRRAILLLPQNTDPGTSETALQVEIAQCLLAMDLEMEGVELLKQHNVCGVNDDLIGYTYATSDRFDPEDATEHLVRAYSDCMQTLVRTMCGYANLFARKEDYTSSLDAMLWLIRYLESLKTDDSAVAYVDKLLAPFYAECGCLRARDGLNEEARADLRKAYGAAVRFDAAPTYGVRGLRFCIGATEKAAAYDSIGSTAMEAVEKSFLHGSLCTPEVLAYWDALKQG